MAKKQRLASILNSFSVEERAVLESLGKKRLYSLLDNEHDDELLIAMLRDSIGVIAKELSKEKEEKKIVAREKARERIRITTSKKLTSSEPVEIAIQRLGMFTIPSEIFNLFCSEFGFTPNEGKRKIVNLYTYRPTRTPLVSLNVTLDSHQLEWLFIDTLGEYYLLSREEQNYKSFCGLFSREVYAFLESIGNRTIRKRAEKARKISDCYVYDEQGKLIKIIEGEPKKEGKKGEKKEKEFTHISNQAIWVSLEELREKELDQLSEEELEELFQS